MNFKGAKPKYYWPDESDPCIMWTRVKWTCDFCKRASGYLTTIHLSHIEERYTRFGVYVKTPVVSWGQAAHACATDESCQFALSRWMESQPSSEQATIRFLKYYPYDELRRRALRAAQRRLRTKPIRVIVRLPISLTLRRRIFVRDKFRCVLCGASGAESRLELDHIQPVAHGGCTSENNLRLLCFDCNRGKRDDLKEGKD